MGKQGLQESELGCEELQFECAFGLDLSGYSRDKSALAYARRSTTGIAVTLLRDHPFEGGFKNVLQSCIKELNKEEKDFLVSLPELGIPLLVDIPIDLQGVDKLWRADPAKFWQLCFRPIDYAFDAMAPLASYLGVLTIRFLRAYCRFASFETAQQDDYSGPVSSAGYPATGFHLFETYPKVVLQRALGEQNKNLCNYKGGKISWKNNKWLPLNHDKSSDIDLAEMARKLLVSPTGSGAELTNITDDEFDAIVCALTGVSKRLPKQKLNTMIASKISARESSENIETYEAPRGYFIPIAWANEPIKVVIETFEEWFNPERLRDEANDQRKFLNAFLKQRHDSWDIKSENRFRLADDSGRRGGKE
jgi:hypothetical protein